MLSIISHTQGGEAKKMKAYICTVCGYVYEEARGVPEAGIAPGTRWEELPADWVCPVCRAAKDAFRERTDAPQTAPAAPVEAPEWERELSAMEMSVICSNLARGCEKQYLAEEAGLFAQLAGHFRAKAEPAAGPGFDRLLELVEKDLQTGYPYANAAAAQKPDRGALRALVWSEKVTRMLDSLLKRYAQEGDQMLAHTGVYVCTVCGFVSVGDAPPECCPVCKVPGWKFEKMEGRAL